MWSLRRFNSGAVDVTQQNLKNPDPAPMSETGGVAAPPAFLPLPGVPNVPWEEWIENFEDYVEARGGIEKWTDKRKVALLKHCLGQEGQAVYRTVKDQPVEGDTEFDKAKKRLDNRFAKRKGLAAARLEFAGRKQQAGESIREFVSALTRLSKKCQFPITAEEAILTQLIVNTSNAEVRKQLMLLKDMKDFDKTVEIAAQAELNLQEAAAFTEKTAVDINELHRTRPTFSERARPAGRDPIRQGASAGKCRRCDSDRHETQAFKCPARTAVCHKCKKVGHFRIVCGRRNEQGINQVDLLPRPIPTPEESWNDSLEAWEAARARNRECENKVVPIYQLRSCSQPVDREIEVNARVGKFQVRFLADTGAAVSIMNKEVFGEEMPRLEKARIVLKGFGGELIRVLGVCRDVVTIKGRTTRGGFYVVETGRSILGEMSWGS